MCFSQFAQYAPRPVYEYQPPERPEGAPPTAADLDDNLYGPKPLPPQWQKPLGAANSHNHAHTHEGNGVAATPAPVAAPATTVAAVNSSGAAIASVSTQTVEAVVVELSNGTKLLICPL